MEPAANKPTPEEAVDYVRELVTDAKLVANYGARSGLIDGSTLFKAIAAAEALDGRDKAAGSEAISKLQEALNDVIKVITPATLLALRGGWDPFDEKRSKVSKTLWPMIIISVLVMIVVSNLSIIYNTGLTLLRDIEANSTVDPERRLNELARQLVEARREIASDTIAAVQVKNGQGQGLKWQAYFRIYDDLEHLNRRVSDLNNRVYEFSHQANNPLWGLPSLTRQAFRTLLPDGWIDTQLPNVTPGYSGGSYSPQSDLSWALPKSLSWLTQFKNIFEKPSISKYCSLNPGYQEYVTEQIVFIKEKMAMESLANGVKDYLQANYYLKCFELSSKFGAPDLISLKRIVNNLLTPYALWILPGLYGAFGALLFHLRRLLDPLAPNPRFIRTTLRVALGGLAGMVLGWFWTPDNPLGTELAGTGFTLFGLSFLFGFSLDVFFTALDKLVRLIEASIGRIGQTT